MDEELPDGSLLDEETLALLETLITQENSATSSPVDTIHMQNLSNQVATQEIINLKNESGISTKSKENINVATQGHYKKSFETIDLESDLESVSVKPIPNIPLVTQDRYKESFETIDLDDELEPVSDKSTPKISLVTQGRYKKSFETIDLDDELESVSGKPISNISLVTQGRYKKSFETIDLEDELESVSGKPISNISLVTQESEISCKKLKESITSQGRHEKKLDFFDLETELVEPKINQSTQDDQDNFWDNLFAVPEGSTEETPLITPFEFQDTLDLLSLNTNQFDESTNLNTQSTQLADFACIQEQLTEPQSISVIQSSIMSKHLDIKKTSTEFSVTSSTNETFMESSTRPVIKEARTESKPCRRFSVIHKSFSEKPEEASDTRSGLPDSALKSCLLQAPVSNVLTPNPSSKLSKTTLVSELPQINYQTQLIVTPDSPINPLENFSCDMEPPHLQMKQIPWEDKYPNHDRVFLNQGARSYELRRTPIWNELERNKLFHMPSITRLDSVLSISHKKDPDIGEVIDPNQVSMQNRFNMFCARCSQLFRPDEIAVRKYPCGHMECASCYEAYEAEQDRKLYYWRTCFACHKMFYRHQVDKFDFLSY